MASASPIGEWNSLHASRIRSFTTVIVAGTFAIFPLLALSQPSGSAIASDANPFTFATFEAYVKITGAVIAGIVALIGLPIVFLTYKKTRAEVAKLELEAQALRQKLNDPAINTAPADIQGTRVNIENSRDIAVQVLADPRLLGPLLVVLNFIVAWIYLTLARHLFGILDVGGDLILLMLSAVLLLPIAGQATQMSSSFKSAMSAEQIAAHTATMRRTRSMIFLLYVIVTVGSVSFGGFLIWWFSSNAYQLGYALGWMQLLIGVVALLAIPYVRRWLVRNLQDI